MPNKFQKSLQDYFSKLKKTSPNLQFRSSKEWVLSGCNHRPKTLSFAIERDISEEENRRSDTAATLSDIDRFLFENFRSLYLNEHEEDKDDKKKKGKEDQQEGDKEKTHPGLILFESPRFMNPPPGLRGSNRFFVAPGSTGLLIEEARTSATMSSEDTAASTSNISKSPRRFSSDHSKAVEIPEDSIAVLKHSQSPYDDFRNSMEEIIEARLEQNELIDWDFMEELLFCYLNLNEKRSYKYILSAFVDLVVVLRQKANRVPPRSRRVRIGRERKKKTVMRERRNVP